MTTSTFDTPVPTTLDLSGTPRIPLSRLVRVELRKLVDTRASRWLLIAIAAITALIVVLVFINADRSDRTFVNFVQATGGPQGFLLPVLGILLVTSEWGQRTALVTFTLMPVRGRVLVAKVVAAVLAGIAAVLVAMGLAALATLAGGATSGWAHIGIDDVGKLVLVQLLGILQGLAFGLLLLNSAAAIVLYYVLPIAFTIVASLWKWLAHAQPWVDLNVAQTPLLDAAHMNATAWGHLASAAAIWVVLPFVLGLVRVLRAEVK